jgi:hypothetical protein
MGYTFLILKIFQFFLLPPLQIIRSCADAGIIFFYGMMLDPVQRSLSDLRQELEFGMEAERSVAVA